MAVSKFKDVILFCLLYFCFSMSACSDNVQKIKDVKNAVVPLDLKKHLESKECRQVDKFYEIYPDIKSPPYVYEILADEDGLVFSSKIGKKIADDETFAVWCEGEKQELRKYYLVVNYGNEINADSSACPSKIGPFKNIGGLTVEKGTREPLSWYRYFDTEEQYQGDELTDQNIIASEYDGMGHLFYCVQGKWLYRVIH